MYSIYSHIWLITVYLYLHTKWKLCLYSNNNNTDFIQAMIYNAPSTPVEPRHNIQVIKRSDNQSPFIYIIIQRLVQSL